jgi:DNA polymerase III subunit gamma/tau
MTYEVLARKWRPQVFAEVVGQDHITQTLVNAIKNERLAHAYLFSGPRGVGKTTVARILAKAINCEQGEPGIPCNECRSCREITEGSSVDVQEIDGASNRRIEEIRELRENIKYMPSSSSYRIYIIDEVHMLTKEAFNALLKTLEEPPPHAKFIFATTETHKVPVTILSRCQRFDFKRIPLIQMVDYLEKITREEGIEISKSGLGLISREAEGSMRDAESLLDQVISFAGSKIEDRHVGEILGIVDRDIVFEASGAIIEGDPKKCLEIVESIYNYGYDIKEFYRALMDQFRNLLISLIAPQERLLEMSEDEKGEAHRQAETAGDEKLQILLNFMISREEDLRFTSHPRLLLEAVMIRLCHLGDFLSYGDLLDRIETLERRLSSPSPAVEDMHPEGISDPAVSWTPARKPGAAKGAEDTEKRAPEWEEFLAFLSSKSKPMCNVLQDWRLRRLSDGNLEIEKGSQSFSSAFFDDPERLSEFKAYCRDFFRRDINIRIFENSRPSSRGADSPSVDRPESRVSRHKDLPPPVQDLLNTFQGEVEEGLSDRTAGRVGRQSEAKKEES